MYTLKGIVYAEAGYLVRGRNMLGFCLEGAESEFTESPIITSDLAYDGMGITFNNGMFYWDITGVDSYPKAKKYLVEKRYSNDDQIAIILNKDDGEAEALAFDKMQEWRAWAGQLARQIVARIEEYNNSTNEENGNNTDSE